MHLDARTWFWRHWEGLMRNPIGFVVSGCLMLAAVAWAQPPGVTERDGAWISPEKMPLYTFARDTEANVSNCNDRCASAWPPLMVAEGGVSEGDWTVVTREDGSRQWAYKSKPLYTYARDTAGEAAAGVSAAWPLAKK